MSHKIYEARELAAMIKRVEVLEIRKEQLIQMLDETKAEIGLANHYIKIKTLKAEND